MGTGRPLQMSSSPVLCAQCTSALLNASSRSMQAGVQNVKMTKLMAYVSFVADSKSCVRGGLVHAVVLASKAYYCLHITGVD